MSTRLTASAPASPTNLQSGPTSFENPIPQPDPIPQPLLSPACLVQRLLAVVGIGYAVDRMTRWNVPGLQPSELDERIVPLCGLGATVPSFNWLRATPPPQHALRKYLLLLASRLGLTSHELVFAYVVLEQAMESPSRTSLRPILRPYTARKLLLGACVIAIKYMREQVITLRMVLGSLQDLFTNLKLEDLVRIEKRLLNLIDFTLPHGDRWQTTANALYDAADHVLNIQGGGGG